MKRTLSLLLSALMILTMIAGMGISASAADGDVLYTVNFNGDDKYSPWAYRYAAEKMADTTVEVADGGKTIIATAPASAGSAWFYGSAIKGLDLGVDKKYTMTMKVAFPTGNAGVYFNFGDKAKTDDPLTDKTYLWQYGVYGQIKANPATCMTMSYGAGGKLTGDLVSSLSAYTAVPAGIANDADGFVDIRFEIDGLFYAVYFNDILYDHVWMNDDVLKKAPHLGFTIYLYNNNAKVTVKDVVIKQGCEHGQKLTTKSGTALNYADYKDGEKIMDLLFNAKEGPFQAMMVQDAAPARVQTAVSEDGKTLTLHTLDGDGSAHWYGGTINGLKITDDTKYTFTFKNKDQGSKTVGSVAFNAADGFWSNYHRFNWYGSFTNGANPNLKFAYNGTNFADYNYPGNASGGENMKVFNFVPAVDADGFCDIVVELDGWTWSIWLTDAADGVQKKVQTLNLAEICAAANIDYKVSDELAFIAYIYNKNLTLTIKDAALYKGNILSNPPAPETEAPTAAPTEAPTAAPTEAPTAAPTEAPTAAPTAAPTEAPTAAPTEAPTAAPTEPVTEPENPFTGDSFAIYAIVAVVAVLGTAVVIRKKVSD